MPNPVGATSVLARFVASAAQEALPVNVAEKAAFCFLDALGLARSGSTNLNSEISGNSGLKCQRSEEHTSELSHQ